MSVSAVSNTSSTQASSTDSSSLIPQKTLNQDDFLKLLVAQMSAQDPMNPMSNADFMGQMAQFSTLEQTRSMESQVSELRDQQAITQATSMIGRDVSLTTSTGTVKGTISAVNMVDGTPKIVVNGNAYDLSKVLTISPATVQAN